jgi:hypothetical protein
LEQWWARRAAVELMPRSDFKQERNCALGLSLGNAQVTGRRFAITRRNVAVLLRAVRFLTCGWVRSVIKCQLQNCELIACAVLFIDSHARSMH